MKLDDTNKAIIRQLADGRKAFSQVAEEIGVTENTVRARVNNLEKDGVLKIMGLVDPQKLVDYQLVMIGLKFKSLNLEEKAKELLKLKEVISAMVVTGRYDMIIHVIVKTDDNQNLLNFFKNELSKVEGLSEVETYVVYQSYGFDIPFPMV